MTIINKNNCNGLELAGNIKFVNNESYVTITIPDIDEVTKDDLRCLGYMLDTKDETIMYLPKGYIALKTSLGLMILNDKHDVEVEIRKSKIEIIYSSKIVLRESSEGISVFLHYNKKETFMFTISSFNFPINLMQELINKKMKPTLANLSLLNSSNVSNLSDTMMVLLKKSVINIIRMVLENVN